MPCCELKDSIVRVVDRAGGYRKAEQDPRDLVLLAFLQPEKRIPKFSVMSAGRFDSIREFFTREKDRQ
ncbi:hypothetical protein CFB89_33625 [Burkholderia sp. AU16741]|nr:hypothetical protein CFB89_33625 [Burkholderia sp. AU16741]